MSQPTDMKAAKARLGRKKYAALVLAEFSSLEHEDKRKIEENRAEVERKARKQL
jgi:hypothetical protein